MPDNEPIDLDEQDDTLAALAEAADEVIHPTRPNDLGQKKTRHDNDGRIVTDVPCKACNYNLRGQLPMGTCPECGFPIEESLKSEQLRFADLGWLRKLRFGLTWIIIGTLGGSIVNALFQLLAWLVLSSRSRRFGRPKNFADLDLAIQISVVMDFLVFAIPSVMLCIGYWSFTQRDPHAETKNLSQQMTRWTFLPSYIVLIALKLYLLVLLIITLSLPDSAWFAVGLTAPGAVMLFVGFPSMMLYLRGLAHRMPSRKLMKHTSIVMWGLLGSIAGLGLLIVATIFIRTLGRNEVAVLLLASPMLLGVAIFSIWYLVLLFVYRGRISKTIRSARRLRRASTLDPKQAHEAATSQDVAGVGS